MQIEKNIAATLQRKMNAAGKTKLEFSKELGIPRSTFQEYLKGDKCLRSDSIEELAKSLSISPAQLISGPEYADARGLFSADALLAELQTLHPRAQELAKEAVSLLQTAFRISAEWDKLDTLSADPVSEVPESAYRYVLYEAHGAARMLYAYGNSGPAVPERLLDDHCNHRALFQQPFRRRPADKTLYRSAARTHPHTRRDPRFYGSRNQTLLNNKTAADCRVPIRQ